MNQCLLVKNPSHTFRQAQCDIARGSRFIAGPKTMGLHLVGIFIFSILILSIPTNLFAQKIIRSSLSSFGNVVNENGTIYRQTIGQSSSTSVLSNEKTNLRQGFQQPVLAAKSTSAKEKECTLYLSPNPTSDIVSIKFAEEIGENQISVYDMMGKLHFKINILTPYYQMDVSKLPKGVYMVSVESKSGYRCNQKLIVI